MNKLVPVIVLCYISLIFYLIGFGHANDDTSLDVKHRTRRYLSFTNNSKFFVRLNFRANIIPWTQIFAHAAGLKVNFDMPPDSFHPYHHLNRRSVYNNLESLLNGYGIDGYHCIRRAICETNQISEPRGLYHKILKMVFRHHPTTEKWHKVTSIENECLLSMSTCPISVMEVSQYTDI